MSDVNPTRVDILSLSDDDFGSKYGRDRTTKEVATKNANDAAGYKAAEADFKKESKAERKSDIQSFADKRSPESKAAAEQRMKDYTEGRAKSMEQFNANMQKTSEAHDAKMKELRSTTKSGGGGGGSGGIKSMKYEPKTFKSGGKVSSASKRADGCAIKGKTKGRIV